MLTMLESDAARPAFIGQIDTTAKTINEVVVLLQRQLRAAELDPEWLDAANFAHDPNQGRYGPPPNALWPLMSGDRRLGVSVSRGSSEGWMIEIAFARWIGIPDNGHWQHAPLIRGKSLTRSHAWSVAAAIARILDID